MPQKRRARTDLVPVILGGDIGVYALGREFHEAYGVTSVCVAEAPIGAISHSAIFAHEPVESLDPEVVLPVVRRIAQNHANGHVLLIANTDANIDVIDAIRERLPDNVACPIPSREAIDRVGDKAEFARLCEAHGLDTPKTEVVHLAGDAPIAPTSIPMPCVAKPSVSAEYMHYLNEGFKKVYFVERQEQLDTLWNALREAGFTGDFLVQELIAGDDTYMDSITIYVATDGRATMYGAAHVLLEDHAPTMLGNPVAMITCQMPELWERASALLAEVGYRGFANFDIKRDPATGRTLFLEVNPRIGRNSYYNCAAGVNPMQVCVEDIIDGEPSEPRHVSEEVLYTLVPTSLLRRYVRDEQLSAQVDKLIRDRKVFDPQRYEADRGIRRMIDVELTEKNQIRKFAKYYPQPTDTSF